MLYNLINANLNIHITFSWSYVVTCVFKNLSCIYIFVNFRHIKFVHLWTVKKSAILANINLISPAIIFFVKCLYRYPYFVWHFWVLYVKKHLDFYFCQHKCIDVTKPVILKAGSLVDLLSLIVHLCCWVSWGVSFYHPKIAVSVIIKFCLEHVSLTIGWQSINLFFLVSLPLDLCHAQRQL